MRGLLANRAVYQLQRHSSLLLLAWAAQARGGWLLSASVLALYLLENPLCGRMAATAAAFFLAALGTGPARFLFAGLAGWAASLAYQAAERRWLLPWARRRELKLLLEGPGAVVFWSGFLLALTAAGLALV